MGLGEVMFLLITITSCLGCCPEIDNFPVFFCIQSFAFGHVLRSEPYEKHPRQLIIVIRRTSLLQDPFIE